MILLLSFFPWVYFDCFACTSSRFFRRVGQSCTSGALLLACTSEPVLPSYPRGLCLVQRKSWDLLWVLNTWDKVTRRCPCPWRGLPNSAVSSMGCLKHQGDMSLGSWCPAPMPKERPATAAPYRPQGVWKCQAPGRRETPRGSFPPWSFLP